MTHPATRLSSSNGVTRQQCHVGPNKSNLRRDAPAGLGTPYRTAGME